MAVAAVGLLALIVTLTGCAGVPKSSAPQAIGTVDTPAPRELPNPSPGMDPDVLLREFLKATADPEGRHQAARQFLTSAAAGSWDDAGSALLIDHVVFVETRTADRVSIRMHADILGSLSDVGVFETGDGALPDPGVIELVKRPDGWRIDQLPNGVFLDWQKFQSTYKRYTLYFAEPTGHTMVPDPRYLAVSDSDQLATELISKLIAGPRPELSHAVRNMAGAPLKLRGPVTRADGGKAGIGKGYGGARIDLEGLSTTDPQSRALLAAQLIWTLARADIRGPYVINADGAPLDDRFAEGWETSDVAATDPGVADGAAAGLHALVGGSLVALDGQRLTPMPGSFGALPEQRSAALSRDGSGVGAVVVTRPGTSDAGAQLWIGAGGQPGVMAAEGHGITRPTWALDSAVWVVIDGNNVVRVTQEAATGAPARVPVDSTAVADKFPGVITELQLSRDGIRAAMVIDGQVVLAAVEQAPGGEFSLTRPRRLGYGLGKSVTALSWRTGDDMVVTRTDADHPVSFVNLDGINSDAPTKGLTLPVSTVAANPSTVYVADRRGVMALSGSAPEGAEPAWTDVRPLMVDGAVPVLPG